MDSSQARVSVHRDMKLYIGQVSAAPEALVSKPTNSKFLLVLGQAPQPEAEAGASVASGSKQKGPKLFGG